MRFSSHPSIHRPARHECSGHTEWIYLVKFRLHDPILSTREMLAHELQQSLYDEGCMAGNFMVASIDDDVAWVVIVREGCEVDYHTCYGGASGHDGSDKTAIQQVKGEVTEGLDQAPNSLVSFEEVADRAVYTSSPGSPSFWGMAKRTSDWPNHLLAA